MITISASPWQIGGTPGPKEAATLKPETAAKLIQVAKRPLLVAGSLTLETKVGDGTLIDFVIELGKLGIPVVATTPALKGFLKSEFNPSAFMGLSDLINRLTDPTWSLDDNGAHDLVIFLGIRYSILSQMLSTLKNFTQNPRTMSLNGFFQPNADWSFPNMKEEEWEEKM
ncbi:MAG: CO dehydrogenase/acetyl-CoA synthase complex subunit epsilon, partial [Candidatus Heimdallarchaeota archaeon]